MDFRLNDTRGPDRDAEWRRITQKRWTDSLRWQPMMILMIVNLLFMLFIYT